MSGGPRTALRQGIASFLGSIRDTHPGCPAPSPDPALALSGRHERHDHPAPPRRLAPAPARRRGAEGGPARNRAPFRPCHRDAEPRAPGGHRRAGLGLSAAHSRGPAHGPGLHTADDALPDGKDRPVRREGGGEGRHHRRGQALPRRGDHQLGLGRARLRQGAPRARGDGRDRPAALRPRRGHGRRHRHLRPRGGVHRPRARPDPPEHPRPARGDGTHHDPRRRGLCAGRRRGHRRDDHHPSPCHQPQPPSGGRDPAALLLPAGGQARRAPAGAARRRDLGRCLVLPRDRQRAACRRGKGKRLRLRGLLHGDEHALDPGAGVRGGRRARPA